LLAVIAFACPLSAHPVFQHHFNNIVNSNPCLKTCMDEATVDDVELSLLKTANISGYLLNIESICRVISTARSCIAGCGVDSNPFALESMTAVCSQQSLADVEVARQCLTEQGNEIVDQCRTQCGDYDEINDQVHKLTKSFRPELNEPEKVAEVMTKINDACGTLKCSDRCVTKTLSEQCSPLDKDDVGSVVQRLIQRVLAAQRRDLDRMQLVDAMAQSVPIQCNFMYMPDVMFNGTKDELALAVIDEVHRSERIHKDPHPARPATVPTGEGERKKALNLALSQFQAHLLKKQIHLLDIQERNLLRESQKLDMELQILARKRAQSAFDDNMNGKQQQFY